MLIVVPVIHGSALKCSGLPTHLSLDIRLLPTGRAKGSNTFNMLHPKRQDQYRLGLLDSLLELNSSLPLP